MKNKTTEILYRNHQWMVVRDPNEEVFLVEVDKNYPSDTQGGYWISVRNLACAGKDGRTEMYAICEKRWVDTEALEDAVRQVFARSGIKPNYDLDKAIDAACVHYQLCNGYAFMKVGFHEA